MHDLGKSSRQRVLDIVQERGVGIEVRESFCLELKSFASKVIVDELKHSALGSAGRIDGCKRSQDRLRVRGRGFVYENFRVRPKVSEVYGLQELVEMQIKNQKEAEVTPSRDLPLQDRIFCLDTKLAAEAEALARAT
jgi:hypothetical protein